MPKRRPRPTIALDVEFPDRERIEALTDAAFRVHVTALCYCGRARTDGRVPRRRALLMHHLAETAIDELVRRELWEPTPDGWTIPGYLRWQLSRADWDELTEKRRAAARTRWNSNADASCIAGSNANAMQDQDQEEVTEEGEASPPVEPARRGDDVQRVFDAWVEACGRSSRTRLDDKRRKLIQRRLDDYDVDELIDAVRGWRRSPHHRGENATRTVYNDLGLLLRDAEHVERFRDLERGAAWTEGQAPRGRSARSNVSADIARLDAAAQRARLLEGASRQETGGLDGVQPVAGVREALPRQLAPGRDA